ncbi:MAG: cyclase family protein [Christensenellales bacterium]
MPGLWEKLEQMKKYRWVDLTHTLTNQSPYWDGIPNGSVALCEVAVPFEAMDLEIQTFKFPGQFGTHIDYPAHFVQGGRVSQDFSIRDTVLPLVVIDATPQVKENVDFELSVEDILAFEAQHGKIPEGSFVALRSDWGKRWPDGAALSNIGEDGNEHFPGWGMKALEFLFDERNVAAIGHETLDTDAPISSKDVGLVCERYVLQRDKFQVEMLTNLDQVPPTGAVIVIQAPKIENANGMPVRAFAIVED